MRKNRAHLLLSLCVICAICGFVLAPGTARAQVATGTPPFGSFSGGPDVVNNANLNVHLTIPVFNKAGRGLPFNYNLTYDSSIWYPGASTWLPVTNWGWPGVTQAATGRITFATSQGGCFYPQNQYGQP